MYGEEEDFSYCMSTCKELGDLRREVFSTHFRGIDWLEKNLEVEI